MNALPIRRRSKRSSTDILITGGLTAGAFFLALMALTAGPVAGQTASGPLWPHLPKIAPIQSLPHGQSYGHWAVEWWQWALGIPGDSNPLPSSRRALGIPADSNRLPSGRLEIEDGIVLENGIDCSERQVGEVWFLAGSFFDAPVSRSCEIPAGKSLFFPLVNVAYAAFLNDPQETTTDEYMRLASECIEAEISVTIDDVEIKQPASYFTGPGGSQSPFFNIQLPPDNVFGADAEGIPELVLSPSAEQGYYLFVWPLAPGEHTIHWTASCRTREFPDLVNFVDLNQDITYHLTVTE